MAPPTSLGNDDFALKSFVTRNRSLARRSVHGPPKSGIFNLTGNNNNNSQNHDSNSNSNNGKSSLGNAAPSKPKRPVSIISGIDSGSGAGSSGATRTRPMSMISVSSSGGASSSTNYGGIPQRNPFKLDLMLENDASTTSINNSSNAQSFNQNVLRNNFSNVDKKIFNTPQMTYSPELNNPQGAHNSTQTINLGPNINHNNHFSEKKFNLGVAKSSPSTPATIKENSHELEYNTNIRSIHRQFNINKFNVSLKTDLLKDVKKGKTALIKEFDKIQESIEANSKTPIVNEFSIRNKMTNFDDEYMIDWEFWKSVIDHYPTKMTKVKSLKKIETAFSNHGVPQCIRPAIYLYLTNSKTQTLEKIYKENSVISFFSKENDLRLRICETFNIDLRCLKSSQEQFDIGDLDKELLQKVDKDLFEILRNFTIYYDRGGYSEIKGLLSPESSPSFVDNDDAGSNIDKTFYLPSKAIISICGLLLKNCARDEGVLNIKTSDAKLTKPEIFSLLIMLNENYFNFDNEINAKNLRIIKERRKQDNSKPSAPAAPAAAARSDANSISSRRSSMTIDSTSSFSKITPGKETDLNNIKNNYHSDVNKDKFVYIFNRSLEDLFPEVFLYLTSKGIHTNILLERFVFEFFHRFSDNYKWFDNENQDENNVAQENTDPNKEINVSGVLLNKADIDNIKASINDFSLLNIADIKGDLDEELDNEIFKNCYKLSNENLLRILDMVLIQGVEFLIKFLLLVVEKNYFKIFKIKNNKVLMKFLSSNAVFNFFRDESHKFVTKKIYESEIGQYENISSFITQPSFPNPFEDVSELDADEEQPTQKLDVKQLAKNTPLRSDIEKQNKTVPGSAGKRKSEKQQKLIEITIKEKKQFGDFIAEALKFEPVIYKYEEELKYLQKEKQAMDAKIVETGTGIGFVNGEDKLGMHNNNSSELSITSTLTSDFGDNSFTRNSSRSSLSLTNDDLVVTPELKGLKSERKENKIRVMKLQTDLNNLTLTHKSYKEEILIKNEKLNKIKNMNLELKLQKEQLEKRLNDLQLKEELFHSVIRNSNIAKMNDDVKLQIEGCAADIRNVVGEIDGYKAKNKMMRDKYEKPGTPKSSAAAFFSGFGFGRK